MPNNGILNKVVGQSETLVFTRILRFTDTLYSLQKCKIFNQLKLKQSLVITIVLSVSACFKSHGMFFHCWCQPNCSTNALPDSRENSDLQSVQVCWQTKQVNKLTPVQSLKSNETADTLTNCTASMCFVSACGLWHWIALETATRPYFQFNSLWPGAANRWITLMAVGGTRPLGGRDPSELVVVQL